LSGSKNGWLQTETKPNEHCTGIPQRTTMKKIILPSDGELASPEDETSRVQHSELTGSDTSAADVDGEHSAQAAEELSVEEQLRLAVAERDANYDKWMRTQAEIENFRRRVQKEAVETRKYQGLPLFRDLLPALDNLDRAIHAAESGQDVGQLVQGLQMVAKQFTDILVKHDVRTIDALHEPFDPSLHEAAGQVPSSDHPPMTVLEELERGYALYDRVIRPSKVIVSSAAESVSSQEEASDVEPHTESDTPP